MASQNNMNTADTRYYPFTENNPFAPWYSKWSIALFGESDAAKISREQLKVTATSWYEQIRVHNSNLPSGIQTPNIGGLGIGINSPFPGTPGWKVSEAIDMGLLAQKLNSVSPIPTNIPLPESLDTVAEWNKLSFASKRDITPPELKVATGSNITVEMMPVIEEVSPVIEPVVSSPVASSPAVIEPAVEQPAASTQEEPYPANLSPLRSDEELTDASQ